MSLTVASYGGGINSTAMLIGIANRHALDERFGGYEWGCVMEMGTPLMPDHILFSDTGAEKPETYAYVKRFDAWLRAHDMPPITTVREDRFTLEQECLDGNTLPSIVMGFRSCSDKFKQRPQRRYVASLNPDWPVIRLIGFDAGEAHRVIESPEPRYINRYPLVEWGWDRDRCIIEIERAGLCVPPKSSCFFCPNMREEEVLDLRDAHPDLLDRALHMERNATTLTSIKGLARDMSWRQIVDYDRDQLALLPKRERVMPCACYDGGSN